LEGFGILKSLRYDQLLI